MLMLFWKCAYLMFHSATGLSSSVAFTRLKCSSLSTVWMPELNTESVWKTSLMGTRKWAVTNHIWNLCVCAIPVINYREAPWSTGHTHTHSRKNMHYGILLKTTQALSAHLPCSFKMVSFMGSRFLDPTLQPVPIPWLCKQIFGPTP